MRDLTAAAAGSTGASLPVFLVAALAVQLREALHFGEDAQGVVVALYFLSAALTSIPFGHLVERLGGSRVMRWSCAVTGATMVGFAAGVRSWGAMIPVMVVAGMSSAAMQVSANVFLARRIPPHRLGFAFGVKQSSVPVSTLLAGLAVPGIALTVGWRWAFVVAGAAVLVIGALLPRPRTSVAAHRSAGRPARLTGDDLRPLVLLSVAFSLGIAAATAMAGFLATSSVASGVGKGTAGLLVALGGVAAFIARVMAGVRADRRDGRHLRAVAVMLLAGAGGYVLIALASGTGSVALLVPGVTLAFASGWGWNGLFNFSVVRSYADRPAQATAITQAGGRVGGVVGPLLFGFAASHASYATAWVGAAAAAVVSAVMVSVARHELRSRARRTTSLVPVTDPSLGD